MPHDLSVGIKIEWLDLVEVPWLSPVGARLAQPVNLLGLYEGTSVAGIPGLIVWPGWTDPEVVVPSVIGLPDSQGRFLRGESASLAAALDLLHDLSAMDPEELTDLLGMRLVDARVDP